MHGKRVCRAQYQIRAKSLKFLQTQPPWNKGGRFWPIYYFSHVGRCHEEWYSSKKIAFARQGGSAVRSVAKGSRKGFVSGCEFDSMSLHFISSIAKLSYSIIVHLHLVQTIRRLASLAEKITFSGSFSLIFLRKSALASLNAEKKVLCVARYAP